VALDLGQTIRGLSAGQKVVGRYSLVRILGRGGMGVVWLARDEKLDRDVALKFLPELVVHDEAVLDDLKRETNRSLELTHPHIVRIHDFVDDMHFACISMEYVDGPTLSALRVQRSVKVFEVEELAPWIKQTCEALDYAHNRARIVHRDLKPANLMLNGRGDLKVADFGVARSLSDSISMLTMAHGTSGTLVYMSPQQLSGERASHLDDIYSLGATIYELITSKPPFYSGDITAQIKTATPPSMRQRRDDLGVGGAAILVEWEGTAATCLAKDPAQRPQSAIEVGERLGLIRREDRRTPVAFPMGTSETAVQLDRGKAPDRKFALPASIAALAMVGGLLGWYYLSQRDAENKAAGVAKQETAERSITSPPIPSASPSPNPQAQAAPSIAIETQAPPAPSAPVARVDTSSAKGKASYSIGLELGTSLKKGKMDVNTDSLLKGVKDGLSGAKPLLTEEQVKETMAALQKEMTEKQTAANKDAGERNAAAGEKFLAENKRKPGVKTTASGLQYKVLREGTGSSPKETDSVVTNYRGTLLDGTEFDSSYKRNEPATFPVNRVIKGWTEALLLMKPGAKYQLFIPSNLAYGERAVGNNIGPNSTLIFEVELISIKPPDAASPRPK